MDFNSLKDKLKDHGLDLAEDATRLLVEDVLDWVAEEVIKTENKYDDMLVAIIPMVKPALLKAVDKIDGEES